jgi:hypothetical protein
MKRVLAHDTMQIDIEPLTTPRERSVIGRFEI